MTATELKLILFFLRLRLLFHFFVFVCGKLQQYYNTKRFLFRQDELSNSIYEKYLFMLNILHETILNECVIIN